VDLKSVSFLVGSILATVLNKKVPGWKPRVTPVVVLGFNLFLQLLLGAGVNPAGATALASVFGSLGTVFGQAALTALFDTLKTVGLNSGLKNTAQHVEEAFGKNVLTSVALWLTAGKQKIAAEVPPSGGC
jgi:hypothetical protein